MPVWVRIARSRALAALLLAFGCAAAPIVPGPPPPAPVCNVAAHAWRQTSPGPCGSAVWRFTLREDGKFLASELGCAGAIGVARFDHSRLILEFNFPGGTGHYTWPFDASCRPQPGEVQWIAGADVRTAPSRLAPAE